MSELPPILILAGGHATRLGAAARDIPKAMMPVAGSPFIDYQLDLLARNGARTVVMCIGYLAEQIRDHVKDGSRFGLSVIYSEDGPFPLGTGGAVRNAQVHVGERCAVLYGDTFLDVDYRAIDDAFCQSKKQALMTVLANGNRWDRSNVVFKDNQVVLYDKVHASAEMQHIDYGLLFFSREAIRLLPDSGACDLSELMSELVRCGDMAGYEVGKRFYEIGTPESLAETEQYLSSRLG